MKLATVFRGRLDDDSRVEALNAVLLEVATCPDCRASDVGVSMVTEARPCPDCGDVHPVTYMVRACESHVAAISQAVADEVGLRRAEAALRARSTFRGLMEEGRRRQKTIKWLKRGALVLLAAILVFGFWFAGQSAS